MFRILHCGRAVLHRATALSNTYSLVVPTSSKYRWKDTFYYVGLRTKVILHNKQKFVSYNLKPQISAGYVKFFIKSVHNVEKTMNPIVQEKVQEMIADWDFHTVERQMLRELHSGSVDLDTVFYCVSLMLVKDYLPEYLIAGVLDFSTANLNDVVRHPYQGTELMLLGFACSARVTKTFLLQMQTYLSKNIHMYQMQHIRYFYLLFEKTRWKVTHPLNQMVVDKMVKEMPDLHHNEIVNIFKSLIWSNYFDSKGSGRIAKSLLENSKILSMNSDQHLHIYMRFFTYSSYYDEALYDSLLENFYFLVNTLKLTSIKSTGLILSLFGSIQFKPEKKVGLYREICEKIEKICLDRQYKPAYFSDSQWVSEFVDGMTYFGFFSDDLLNRLFSSVDRVPDTLLKGVQYLYLHYTVVIEHPDYDGATIPSHVVREMEIDSEERLRWERKSDKTNSIGTIYDVVCEMLGKDYVHWYHILPHFNHSEVEIRLKTDGSVVAFEPETYLQRVASDFEEDDPDLKRIVIMHLSKNSMLPGSPNLKGRTAVKIRQLQKLGYHILTITTQEIQELSTQKERIDFITKLIESNFDVKLQLPKNKKKKRN